MKKILIIHGPNLNLLGRRERDIYGDTSLEEINNRSKRHAADAGYEIDTFQSNNEGDIVDAVHRTVGQYDGAVINPAAFTHTSVAIRDAIAAVDIPFVEVHLSNIHAREEFRRISLTAPVCIGQISGFGPDSYLAAIDALIRFLANRS